MFIFSIKFYLFFRVTKSDFARNEPIKSEQKSESPEENKDDNESEKSLKTGGL